MLPHRSRSGAPSRTGAASAPQRSVLLAMTSRGVDGADSLTLFASDDASRAPVSVFFPTGTLAPVPAHGVATLGSALLRGDTELQELAVENLIGARIERTVTLSQAELQAILDALGGLDVEVAERLYLDNDDGTRSLAFPLGRAHLAGAAAVRYMTMRSGTEIDRFVRARKVFEAIFAAGAQRIASALATVPRAHEFASVWGLLAAASPSSRAYDVLPAEPVGAGPDEVYRPLVSKIDEMVVRDLAPSMPRGVAPSARPRVELRNGNGMPEAGKRAAALLVPEGFRVEVTGNASSFGNPETQIVVYGDDVGAAQLGERIRGMLGIGKVVSSARSQTIVDATIILGEDFQQKE